MGKALLESHSVGIKDGEVLVPALKECTLLHSLDTESSSKTQSIQFSGTYRHIHIRGSSCSGDPTYSLCQTVILTTLLPPVFNFTTSSFPLPQITLFCMIIGDNIHHVALKRARQLAPSLKNDHKLVFNYTISLLIDNMLVMAMVFRFNPGRNLSLRNRLNRFIWGQKKKKDLKKYFSQQMFSSILSKRTQNKPDKIQCSGIYLS